MSHLKGKISIGVGCKTLSRGVSASWHRFTFSVGVEWRHEHHFSQKYFLNIRQFQKDILDCTVWVAVDEVIESVVHRLVGQLKVFWTRS